MRYESTEIRVEGQQTGAAVLHHYLLDTLAGSPDRMRPAVIVCPGGGYSHRADKEGEPIVMQFLAAGFHGFVLDYSVDPNRFPTALLELASAVSLVRAHSREWYVDPEKIFVCGFSAGGHLAGSLGVFWNREFVGAKLGLSAEQVRPSGMILSYPVISSGPFGHQRSFDCLLGTEADEVRADEAFTREGMSLETQVSEDTVPAFLWHTVEDGAVPVENSLTFALALKEHGVPFEMHIYPYGRHGLALANEETAGGEEDRIIPAVQTWTGLACRWVREQ